MRGETRYEQQRRAVKIRRDRDKCRERTARLTVDRGERAGPHAPDQVPGERNGIELSRRRVSNAHESTLGLWELVIDPLCLI